MLGATACTVEVLGTVEVSSEQSRSARGGSSVAARLSAGPALDIAVTDESTTAQTQRRAESGIEQYSVKFGPIMRSMQTIAQSLPGETLWIVLDEWSALPLSAQPLVADFIRRCLLPVSGLVVK